MSDEQSALGSKSARGRKPKPVNDLELPASDVREIASEAPVTEEVATPQETAAQEPEAMADLPVASDAPAAEPPPESAGETPPEPAPAGEESAPPVQEAPEQEAPAQEAAAAPGPAASPSKALPAVIGLVAGLVGGAGGSLFAPHLAGGLGLAPPAAVITAPAPAPAAPDTAMSERLAKAEAALGRAEAALGEARTREDSFRKALESLEARTLKLAQPNPDIDTLRGRLGTLEGESKVLPREVGVLGTKVETLQPKLDSLEKTVETLNGRLAIVGSKDALALANGRLAAQSLLEEEFGSGKPYAVTLDLLARMGAEGSLMAIIKPFAETGAPSGKTLLAEFTALKPKAPASANSDLSLMDRARKAALSMVEIRKTGDVAGKDDEAVLTRVEAALTKVDLNTAYAASARLSPALAPAFAPWRTRLEARIKAGEAVGLLRKDAQAALARAAASAK